MSAPEPIVPLLDPSIRAAVRLGLVRAEPVSVGSIGAELEAAFSELTARLVAEHAGRTPSQIEGLEPARRLYRAFGLDPTRTRPSSEALLRRVLLGKPLPRILNAVDLCNLCALRFLLPIGLYDASRIRGRVSLRPGRPGESYEGVRKEIVHLEGRPVLCDEQGPFGNPTADGRRAAVTPRTESLWMVIFTPAGYPVERLAGQVAWSEQMMARHLAGEAGSVSTRGEVHPLA